MNCAWRQTEPERSGAALCRGAGDVGEFPGFDMIASFPEWSANGAFFD